MNFAKSARPAKEVKAGDTVVIQEGRKKWIGGKILQEASRSCFFVVETNKNQVPTIKRLKSEP